MPLDLWISRQARFDQVTQAHPGAIRVEEFREFFAAAPTAEARGEGLYWVRYPDRDAQARGGDPWFVARFEPLEGDAGGNVVLSLSYSNPRFLRNSLDAFDQGLRIASALGARLFEEVEGQEVRAETIDALLQPGGPYTDLLAGTFATSQQTHLPRGMAPLEFPIGAVDWVSEFFALQVLLQEPLAPGALGQVLGPLLAEQGLRAEELDDGPLRGVSEGGAAHVFATLFDEGARLQIWPARAGRPDEYIPFAPVGRAAFRLASAAARALNGRCLWGTREVDPALAGALEARLEHTLGVELFLWQAQGCPLDPPPTSAVEAKPEPDRSEADKLASMLLNMTGLGLKTGGDLSLLDRLLLASAEQVDEALAEACWRNLVDSPAELRTAKARALDALAGRIEACSAIPSERRLPAARKLRERARSWFGPPAGGAPAASAAPLHGGAASVQAAGQAWSQAAAQRWEASGGSVPRVESSGQALGQISAERWRAAGGTAASRQSSAPGGRHSTLGLLAVVGLALLVCGGSLGRFLIREDRAHVRLHGGLEAAKVWGRWLRGAERGLGTAPQPYVRGRVIAIEEVNRDPLQRLWEALPEDLQAGSPEEVGTLVVVGTLRRKGPPTTRVRVIDVQAELVTSDEELPGYPDPVAIARLLGTLPRR